MSLYQLFQSKGPSGFGYGSTAEEVTAGLSLAGKTILVTGCNSGLGLETMRILALRGARVVGTARTLEKARAACERIGGLTVPLACELSDPTSIQACVSFINKAGIVLDSIICNAGIMALPKIELVHGYEKQFFTNHIGHFMLVTGLIDTLARTGRVVMVSSVAHLRAPKGGVEWDNLDGTKGYGPWRQYSLSKFANILFAKELARRFSGTERTANALHPGIINTGLARNNLGARLFYAAIRLLILKSIEQGAATQVYVATNPNLNKISGQYFVNSNLGTPRFDTEDEEMAKKLWVVSEKIASEVGSK